MKNKLTVEIYGQQYHLTGKASPGHMRQVAGHVDEKMRQIADNNPRLDATKLAVLSAVNIADDYLKLKQEYDEIMHLIEDEQP
ncbi:MULTISPECIES: cell division protein ZapA [Thermoactinomyces]|jgi:cell division protein ZapA|uniref:Cell division protein ZapA n=1 Tax=Thermoactinomyces daqus TaxID=1329516 RepID=A0A7W1XBZ3_9BACL|nr:MULTISPECIES: cell division protein ZapA [Thermoactinomyces]MBA4543742.1 cell division protein ZapA [Thermoactinomyces daqus]MBH8597523.1 cell division protein ZapA [Thermoactinomyces sp. CICC 10523]MBH8603864.1 cell division protein ZapA [Thermoactinomyces sp. CICC 10522]MBH8606603.1 cell division protein ZapA [Thermoactinomyces sp. CICC 10521]